jgi:prolyl oligopeptidase PreP (S9A serine peptidase family)
MDGKKALEFVEKQNKATVAKLTAEKHYQEIEYKKN